MSRMGLDDKLVWIAANNGQYSSKYGYKVLGKNHVEDELIHARIPILPWDNFWKLKVPHKYLLFGWKVLHDAIPVADTLRKYHILVESKCLCGLG